MRGHEVENKFCRVLILELIFGDAGLFENLFPLGRDVDGLEGGDEANFTLE